METPDPDRLTRVEIMLEQQQALLATVRGLAERHAMQLTAIEHRLAQIEQQLTHHDARFDQLQQTLDAIKDLLDRGNGRP
jgi:hypothetical protein